MKDRLVIGVVRTSFGVHGEIKVASVSGEISHFKRLTSVTVRTRRGEREYPVESVRVASGAPIMKLQGIDSPETARLLNGSEIVVDRAHAAPRQEGEHYVADLEGLSVVLNTDHLGTVTGVVEVGERSLLQIQLNDDRSVLVPFVEAFVADVDLDAGRVTLASALPLE